MPMTPADYDGAVPIDGYGPGFIRFGGQVHYGAVLIHEGHAAPWGGLDDLAALIALGGKVDLLLLGLGAEMGRVSEELLDACEAVDLRVEAMATPPAARGYNVMLTEGRRVAVALLPV